MYSFEQSEQVGLFLMSLGVGFILGLIYDILRTVRISFTKGKAFVFIFDVLYFLLFGLITFVFILAFNKGELRFYLIFGEICGAAFYYFSFGLAAIKLSLVFSRLTKKFFSFVFKVISYPFRLIFKALKAVFPKISVFFKKSQKKSQKNRKKHLPKLRLCVYNLLGIFVRRNSTLNGGELRDGEKKD